MSSLHLLCERGEWRGKEDKYDGACWEGYSEFSVAKYISIAKLFPLIQVAVYRLNYEMFCTLALRKEDNISGRMQH